MKFRNMRRPSVGSESASVQAGRMQSAGSAQEGRVQSAEDCTSMHNDGEKEQGLSSFYSSSNVG